MLVCRSYMYVVPTTEGIVIDMGEPDPEPQGNSLGMMQGWSSDFDPNQSPERGGEPKEGRNEGLDLEDPDLSTPQGMDRHLARLHSGNGTYTGAN